MDSPEATSALRAGTYGDVSTALALYGDHELAELVAGATPLGRGIGGRSALLDVDGTPVFVKRVPLTERESLPQNVRSTANLFGLPMFCQYPIGGPGFGAWRELAVHTMTTNWVLSDRFEGFPLMYHWRVLPDEVQPLPEELAEVDGVVAYWDGSSQVRDRIEALRDATASVALFLEYFPHNVHDWLGARVRDDEQALSLVTRELDAGVSFMNARGLLHFDAHFENILTDGHRLYFADYGLALSSRFRLSSEEREFFDRHASYDRVYTVTYLVNWLAAALYGYGRDERQAFVRACAEGERPQGVPPAAAALLTRHAPLAAAMGDFNRSLRGESRRTPFPGDELRRFGQSSSTVFA
ncbi:protein kinase family protein [Streptomyces sp. NBC_01340]|uniref:protein kinase family protein n=1 Tax=unclassified Streptomyces TaxID=2593676 RepID=UPI002254BC1F|nr:MULTISPECIES: protein kinase family protein [unclassified Streptomyces]MCX4459049.1 protein kinase family protein [Streptomyces sp. NBC_01719]MCX4498406.1 protein kinase family protein [Streptomyces sp. NBC_01728]WSI42910.1 protein kinase family protein [Streptomyces sp. NBC_01340]